MIDKLNEVEKRFEEVNELVCNPDIVSDQEKYTKLMRELKHLTPVVEKFREYKKAQEAFEESKLMLDEGGMDADFAQMVKDEFEQSKADMETISEELKVLLLPRDPNDDKMLLSKSAVVQAVRNQHCLQACFSECIQCMLKQRALKPKCSMQTKQDLADIKKSAFPLKVTVHIQDSSLNQVFTVFSVCLKQKVRAEYTHQPQQLLFCLRLRRLTLTLIRRTCR